MDRAMPRISFLGWARFIFRSPRRTPMRRISSIRVWRSFIRFITSNPSDRSGKRPG